MVLPTLPNVLTVLPPSAGWTILAPCAQKVVLGLASTAFPGVVLRVYTNVPITGGPGTGKIVVCAVDGAMQGLVGSVAVDTTLPFWPNELLLAVQTIKAAVVTKLDPNAPKPLGYVGKVDPIDPAAAQFPAWPTKAARTAWFKAVLAEHPRWAAWGLLYVYAHQTAAEQSADATTEHNGVGFGGTDAEILSSFAKQFAAKKSLSPKQWAILHKRLPKYANQIIGHLTAAGVLPEAVKATAAVA